MKRIFLSIMCVLLASGIIANAKESKKSETFQDAAKLELAADLQQAALDGNLIAVKTLLNNGADPNSAGEDSTPVLGMAAYEGHTEIVKFLIEKGADVNVRDKNGISPLWSAAYRGYAEMVKLLLEKGADVDAKTIYYGSTPLWAAAQNGYSEIVGLLLEKGADPNVKVIISDIEWSALKMAKAKNLEGVVQLLERAGAKL